MSTTLHHCVFAHETRSVLHGGASQLTDGITPVNLGANVTTIVPLSDTPTPLGC